MASKITILQNVRQKFSESLINKTEVLRNRYDSIQSRMKFPEKYKNTIWEKWAMYWKQLTMDYKEVAVDTYQGIKTKPIRSLIYAGVAGSTYYSCKNNPDEDAFKEQLRTYNNQLLLLHESCHNPKTSEYLTFIERCYNEGIIRRITLGVVSFLWLADHNKGLALYKATCSYTKPQYLTFHERIIDVGFNNQWHNLEKIMDSYDINDNE